MVYHIESCLKIEKNYTYITSLILFLFEIICEVYETGRICSPNNILVETLSPTNHSKYKSCARAYYIRCLVIKLTRTRICVRNGYLNKGSCFLFLVSSSILNTSHVWICMQMWWRIHLIINLSAFEYKYTSKERSTHCLVFITVYRTEEESVKKELLLIFILIDWCMH